MQTNFKYLKIIERQRVRWAHARPRETRSNEVRWHQHIRKSFQMLRSFPKRARLCWEVGIYLSQEAYKQKCSDLQSGTV